MLTFNLNNTILEVVETVYTYTETQKSYWYYDIKSWRKSITGRQYAPIVMDIEKNQIEYIKKNYFPKVGL